MTPGRFRLAALIALSLVLTAPVSCVGPPALVTEPLDRLQVDKKSDILYYDGPGVDLLSNHLDVYRPLGHVKYAPVVMYVHGGGWKTGDKFEDQNVGTTFARRGIVTVSINYRLAPWARHPAQVRDVARAFDWVRKSIASYGGDPDNIFLCGHSAGGHLVALLALNRKYLAEVKRAPEEISGVICISGVYKVGSAPPFYDGVFDADPETIADASPIDHVSDKQPPFLLFYGDADLPTLDAQALNFFTKIQEKKSFVDMHRIAMRGHQGLVWFIGTPFDPMTDDILRFISAHSRATPGK